NSSSSSTCKGSCTTSSKPWRAASSTCSDANTPSSRTIGWVIPAARSANPSSSRATAKASDSARASAAGTRPWPYALALTTAITRAPRARSRIVLRLCRSAPASITALMSRFTARSPPWCDRGAAGLARQRVRMRNHRSPQYAVRVRVGRVVGEASVLALEGQHESADLTVAVFRKVDLGDAFLGGLLVIDLLAVDQQDHVCVLLDRAAFAQIRHDGFLVVPLRHGAVELRQGNHRDRQLLGENFQAARDFADLGRAILLRARNLHELQIVDDHE